jgi:hypothetical protein
MPDAVYTLTEFKNPAAYFPTLNLLHSGKAHDSYWYGISGEIQRIDRKSPSSFDATLHGPKGEQEIFIKRIHLLDPISAMEGTYALDTDTAPASSKQQRNRTEKMNHPMNEAYVDALFALYASKFVDSKISPHWCRCFGTFNGRVDTYMYNITDEYDSMRVKPWWKRNQNAGIFKYLKDDASNKFDQLLALPSNDLCESDFATLPEIGVGADISMEVTEITDVEELSELDSEIVSEKNEFLDNDMVEEEPLSSNDDHVKLTNPRLLLKRIGGDSTEDVPMESDSSSLEGSLSESDSDSDSCSDYDSDSESDIIEQFVEFNNFPVQVSLLEKAEGTMDALLDNESDDDPSMVETKEARWAAWLFQVIAGLIVAQHYFGFVHNDLHSNNVMWSTTNETYLYYRVKKGGNTFYMKVPTFGRLMKIIDFGRASFTLPGAGFFISDAFFPGNDAATQYNCAPFYDEMDGKRVEPNTSFDLSRLAVSMLESLYQERPPNAKPIKIATKEGGKVYAETTCPVYNLLWEWLTDMNGKNILRTPKGDERYPDFDLYRALASDVRNAVPGAQVEKPIFAKYRCAEKDVAGQVYELILATQ